VFGVEAVESLRPGRAGGETIIARNPETGETVERRKIDPGSPIQGSDARAEEDEFVRTSTGQTVGQQVTALEPPFSFRELETLVQRNSILPLLIDAMEVNADGTGWDIEPADLMHPTLGGEGGGLQRRGPGDADFDPDDAELNEEIEPEELEKRKRAVEAFFDEPWPQTSFLPIRRRLRRDLETVGNAYMECLFNAADELVFCRRLDPKSMRLIKLQDEDKVERALEVDRDGERVEITASVRERRFVQIVGGKHIYFAELGAARDLDKESGEWSEGGPAKDGDRLDFDKRATQVVHFKLKDDVATPYGLPRWISNAPSIVGSRLAEEFNLEFFDAGGVPPLLIIVSGGRMAAKAEQSLRQHFMASGPDRHQAAVMEAFATEGDVDTASKVEVQVERFGSEQQRDSMFEGYIEKSERRVQRAFRLPDLFTGQGERTNFATAFASMLVAEAQVFQTERAEFDEVVNLKILPRLRWGEQFVFKSRPLSVRDVTQQLAALSIVLGAGIADAESVLENVNTVTGLALRPAGEEDDQAGAGGGGSRIDGGRPGDARGRGPRTRARSDGAPALKLGAEVELAALARSVAEYLEAGAVGGDEWLEVRAKLDALRGEEVRVFRQKLATVLYPALKYDPMGAEELATGVLAILGLGRDRPA